MLGLFSTLTLAGGLILTTNSITTIKADNIPVNAGTAETETGNEDTTPTTNAATPANNPTNEFIKLDTVQPYEDDFENLVTSNLTNTYDEHGKELTLKLPNNTGYKTDRIVTINDIKYYRVSTDTFVKVDDIQKTTK